MKLTKKQKYKKHNKRKQRKNKMMKIFTVYDSKAAAYLQPFFCPNGAVAIRAFSSAAKQEGHDFNRYAADYTLFEIGQWDPISGNVNTYETKLNLGMAAEYASAPLTN